MEKKFKRGLCFTLAILTLSNISLYLSMHSKIDTIDFNSLKDKVIELEQNKNQSSLTVEDVENVIMENPELLVKSLAKLRFEQEQLAAQREAEQVEKSLDALYSDAGDPYIGNPAGKHVLTEFVDYNCGACKTLSPQMKAFVALDPEAKVIIKEFPIFQNNPTSAYSAIMATAVFYHDPQAYSQVHNAFMTNQLTREFIDQTIADLGIAKEDLAPHIDRAKQQIEKVRSLGAQLRVSGTPTVFIGAERVRGGLSAMELKARFAE